MIHSVNIRDLHDEIRDKWTARVDQATYQTQQSAAMIHRIHHELPLVGRHGAERLMAKTPSKQTDSCSISPQRRANSNSRTFAYSSNPEVQQHRTIVGRAGRKGREAIDSLDWHLPASNSGHISTAALRTGGGNEPAGGRTNPSPLPERDVVRVNSKHHRFHTLLEEKHVDARPKSRGVIFATHRNQPIHFVNWRAAQSAKMWRCLATEDRSNVWARQRLLSRESETRNRKGPKVAGEKETYSTPVDLTAVNSVRTSSRDPRAKLYHRTFHQSHSDKVRSHSGDNILSRNLLLYRAEYVSQRLIIIQG